MDPHFPAMDDHAFGARGQASGQTAGLSRCAAMSMCLPFVVCIPAHNEALRVARVIAALGAQRGLGSQPVSAVVIANNCSDDTAGTARRAARDAGVDVVVFQRSWLQPSAGRARRVAMEAGAGMLHPEGVLLTTDADAEPDGDWIANSLAALSGGADAVGACLRAIPEEEAQFPPALRRAATSVAEVQALARALEDRIDPTPGDLPPRHGDHTGAGLALTLTAYRAAGGCPPVGTREDLRLAQAVRRSGGIVRHCPDCRVAVSARMTGRAKGGMADTIRAWAESAHRGEEPLVPNPSVLEAAWRRRAARRADAEAAFRHVPPPLRDRRIAAAVARTCPPAVPRVRMAASHAADWLAARLASLEARDAAA